ncbi:hypothetical protein DM01DRAFT_243472, partial [Hesseltinella vesiculosa]
IFNYLPNYQMEISNLEKDGHKIVGYVRKSTQGCSDDNMRRRLIESMILRLKERSRVSAVFVS